MKTYLVTGGAGFIGANLVRRLLDEQAASNVHVLATHQENLWRLSDVLDRVVVHRCDLCDTAGLEQLVASVRPEVIYHLASFGGMPDQQNQQLIFAVNVGGTMALLNACKKIGFDLFVNTGSSSEYGIKSKPMAEDDLPEPVSDYGVAKVAATTLCLKEALFNKLPVYTVRPFAVYGDYEMATRLIPTVIMNALRNGPVSLSGPLFVRDFIYVSDMVDIYCALEQIKPREAFIFNAGTGVQSTIQAVVHEIEQLMQRQLAIQWGVQSPRPWEPLCWVASTQRARDLLGWSAQYNLATGLAKSRAWFCEHQQLYTNELLNKNKGATNDRSINPSRPA